MTAPTPTETEAFEDLLQYLKGTRGFDFTAYKRASLARRVHRRMQLVGVDNYARYCKYLEDDAREFTQLFNTILINVTSFFRDQDMWTYLSAEVIPQILSQRGPDSSIRIWSAGCSSGEEAYTLAIVFAEALGRGQFRERVKVYATDADEEALAQARLATYSSQALEAVHPTLVENYFEPGNGAYVFAHDLRRSVIFGRHDLILDPPISRIDLLACRNTLMYFNAEAQRQVLNKFQFALCENGFLFLGKAETLLTRPDEFAAVDLKKRLFRKASRKVRGGVAMASAQGGDRSEPAGATRLTELAIQTDPTPQIVMNRAKGLAIANDRARTLFGLSVNDIGRPLSELDVFYRPADLRPHIEQALAERRSIQIKNIEWATPAGDRLRFDVTVIPLYDSALEPLGAKVTFRDVSAFRRLEEELKQSHQELETANEELQSTNEELETTNEELQSTVEELETTNEELQSTNEELETMNEELQSSNEELQTANEQLRQNTDELNRANAFFEGVLASFHEGLLVVDAQLRVQAWNSRSEDLWGLRSSEVRGKHLMTLDIGLPLDLLRQPLCVCLSGESRIERLRVTATNRRGRTIEVEITCMPFQLGDNPRWGAIVMMQERTPAATAVPAL
jgi:two-component system CheB/CheR fusion protein